MTEQAHQQAPEQAPAPSDDEAVRAQPPAPESRRWLIGVTMLSVIALLVGLVLWQRLSGIQEQLARQSADSAAHAIEARTLARQAQDIAREAAARQAVMDTRLAEVALQRGQLEELIQSLSRSRDENLVVDIDAAIRLAQQQALLTGSVQPLLAALRSAEQRLARAAQPRLNPLARAIGRDIERVRSANVADTPALLNRVDELARLIDELPLAQDVGVTRAGRGASAASAAASEPAAWWGRVAGQVADEARRLVRVSRIDRPDAALLAPEQAWFLRENLKLRLLNARLALVGRQIETARSDLAFAGDALRRHFDPTSRRTELAQQQLQQVLAQTRAMEMPRIDETLSALSTAAAGR